MCACVYKHYLYAYEYRYQIHMCMHILHVLCIYSINSIYNTPILFTMDVGKPLNILSKAVF